MITELWGCFVQELAYLRHRLLTDLADGYVGSVETSFPRMDDTPELHVETGRLL